MADKEVNKVYSTTDYKKFSFLESNRDLRLNHVAELKESIQEHPLNKPIDVNEKLQIIDGQHRYMAWWELNMPIIYIIHEGWGANEVPVLNSHQKNWNPSDFVNMYCDLGNENYKQYSEFQDRYAFNHGANLLLLCASGTTSGKRKHEISRLFAEGKFEVKRWNWANIIAKQIIELKPFYAGYKRYGFVAAYLQIASDKNFDHAILMDKVQGQQRKMVDCTTVAEFYEMLREIYNFRSRNGSRIIKQIEV